MVSAGFCLESWVAGAVWAPEGMRVTVPLHVCPGLLLV